MKKTSRFRNEPPKLNVYQHESLLNFRLADRFKITKVILREEDVNFHLGLDFVQQKQVIVFSTIIKRDKEGQQSYRERNNQHQHFCSKVIWDGYQRIKQVKYFFQVVQKSGCPFPQCLRLISGNEINFFYTSLTLLLELVLKVQKQGAHFRDLNINSLQIKIGTFYQKIQLEIGNRNCVQFQKIPRRMSDLTRQKQKFLKKGRNQSYEREKKNKKLDSRHDIQIVLDKMLELQTLNSEINSQRKGEGKILNFRQELNKILQVIGQKGGKKQKPEIWLEAVQQNLQKNYKMNAQQLRQQICAVVKQQSQNHEKLLKKYIQQQYLIFKKQICEEDINQQEQQDKNEDWLEWNDWYEMEEKYEIYEDIFDRVTGHVLSAKRNRFSH